MAACPRGADFDGVRCPWGVVQLVGTAWFTRLWPDTAPGRVLAPRGVDVVTIIAVGGSIRGRLDACDRPDCQASDGSVSGSTRLGISVSPRTIVSAVPGGTIVRKTFTTAAIAAALSVIPVTTALATTPPEDPNDVEAVDNPTDENDDSGFDDWGLLGLLGLAGLAGLTGRKRNDVVRTYDEPTPPVR